MFFLVFGGLLADQKAKKKQTNEGLWSGEVALRATSLDPKPSKRTLNEKNNNVLFSYHSNFAVVFCEKNTSSKRLSNVQPQNPKTQ